MLSPATDTLTVCRPAKNSLGTSKMRSVVSRSAMQKHTMKSHNSDCFLKENAQDLAGYFGLSCRFIEALTSTFLPCTSKSHFDWCRTAF
ncbi:hypothetical protein D3C87_1602130 [compost metagenome]